MVLEATALVRSHRNLTEVEKRWFNPGSPRGADKRGVEGAGAGGDSCREMSHECVKGRVPHDKGSHWPGKRTTQN